MESEKKYDIYQERISDIAVGYVPHILRMISFSALRKKKSFSNMFAQKKPSNVPFLPFARRQPTNSKEKKMIEFLPLANNTGIVSSFVYDCVCVCSHAYFLVQLHSKKSDTIPVREKWYEKRCKATILKMTSSYMKRPKIKHLDVESGVSKTAKHPNEQIIYFEWNSHEVRV